MTEFKDDVTLRSRIFDLLFSFSDFLVGKGKSTAKLKSGEWTARFIKGKGPLQFKT